ncbi:twin-arginine translocation signal domain-containing protein [Insolitispirillum peregrinum]|uniref:twin-arginine translocation signal domain-containing protein n=1 Tax=Insolitispirillum peregrinum TaxID=80876 RepID=UPI00361AF888
MSFSSPLLGHLSRRSVLRHLAVAGGTAATLPLAGCLEEPQPALRVASNQWLGYEPLYIAREQGLFTADQITLIEFTSSSAIIRAMRNGNIEVAALTLDETLRLQADALDLVILWPADLSNGGDSLILHADQSLQPPWQHMRLGIEVDAVGQYFLSLLCQKLSLPEGLFDILPIPAGEHESAFLSGHVDAVVTFEPMRSHLLRAGGIEAFSSRQLPGAIADVIVTTRHVVAQRLDELCLLAQGWFTARTMLVNQTPTVLEHLAGRQKLTGTEIHAAMKGILWPDRNEALDLIRNPGEGLARTIEHLENYLLEIRALKGRRGHGSLLDPDVSARVLSEFTPR